MPKVHMAQYDFNECKLIKSVVFSPKVGSWRIVILNKIIMLFLIPIKSADHDLQSCNINHFDACKLLSYIYQCLTCRHLRPYFNLHIRHYYTMWHICSVAYILVFNI